MRIRISAGLTIDYKRAPPGCKLKAFCALRVTYDDNTNNLVLTMADNDYDDVVGEAAMKTMVYLSYSFTNKSFDINIPRQ